MARTHLKRVSETRTVWTDFTPKLGPGDTLSASPTVTVSPSGPTISDEGRNAAAQTVNGVVVAINKAADFKIAGGTLGTVYNCLISIGTTNGETLEWDVNVEIIADRP